MWVKLGHYRLIHDDEEICGRFYILKEKFKKCFIFYYRPSFQDPNQTINRGPPNYYPSSMDLELQCGRPPIRHRNIKQTDCFQPPALTFFPLSQPNSQAFMSTSIKNHDLNDVNKYSHARDLTKIQMWWRIFECDNAKKLLVWRCANQDVH